MIKLPAVNSAAVRPLMTKLTNDADVELDSFPAPPPPTKHFVACSTEKRTEAGVISHMSTMKSVCMTVALC